MPRSWPSTEPEVLEFDLEPGPVASAPLRKGTRASRLRPLYLIGLVIASVLGLALVPGTKDNSRALVPVETLPEPVAATTPTLPREKDVGLLGTDSFAIRPVEVPNDLTAVAGPVSFDGRFWMIGTAGNESTSATVMSSTDGETWEIRALITPDEGYIQVHDLATFGGALVVATTWTFETGPNAEFGYPDRVVLWRSSDGVNWNSISPTFDDGEQWHPHVDLVTDSDTFIIGVTQTAPLGPAIDEAIPEDLTQPIHEGRLEVMVEAPGIIRVHAPPRIELFQSSLVLLPIEVSSWVYRSEGSLNRWEAFDVGSTLVTSSGMVARPGGGFLGLNETGEIVSSIDGKSWRPNPAVPSAEFSPWGDWLVGIELEQPDHLLIGSDGTYISVRLPDPMLGGASVRLAGGSAGLLATVPAYVGTPVQSIVAGSNTWTLDAGMLSVESRDRKSLIVTMGAIKGSYDSRSDAVTIAGFLDEPIVIQLNDLQAFRDSADGVWETHVYISSNAVDWSAGDTAFRPLVEILGPIHGGFLLAVRPRGNPNGPTTFYRTEPIRATNG